MAWHKILFPELVEAIRTGKGATRGIVHGSLNYELISQATTLIAEPTAERRREWCDYLKQMKVDGHQSRGQGTEQGASGMHWTFSTGAVVGALKWALERRQEDVSDACLGWIEDEVGLCRAFRYRGHVVMPQARVKDEKGQGPIDGYRDAFVALALGEKVKKPAKWWADDQTIAVATWRELLESHPEWRKWLVAAKPPRVAIPVMILKAGDGYKAYFEDTPQVRKALGGGAMHRVECVDGEITWWTDWRDSKQAGEVAA